jgi:hypothetical protein
MLSEALLSQQWNVIGFSAMSCVSTVTGFRDAQSERRLSICLKSLSLTSSTFVRAFRSCGNWHISDFVAALVLCCVRALCFSFHVSVFAPLSPPRILCTVGDRTWHPIWSNLCNGFPSAIFGCQCLRSCSTAIRSLEPCLMVNALLCHPSVDCFVFSICFEIFGWGAVARVRVRSLACRFGDSPFSARQFAISFRCVSSESSWFIIGVCSHFLLISR